MTDATDPTTAEPHAPLDIAAERARLRAARVTADQTLVEIDERPATLGGRHVSVNERKWSDGLCQDRRNLLER